MIAGRKGLALLLALFIAQGAAFSLIVPLWEPPDEVRHFAYAKYLADNLSLPPLSYEPAENPVTLAFHPPLYHALVAPLARGYPQENPLLQIRRADDDGKRVFIYSAEGTRFPYSGIPLRAHLMRLVSLALGAVVVLCTWRIAEALFKEERWLPFAAAGLVALNPQFIFISASINDQALSSALGALVLLLVARTTMEGPTARSTFLMGIVFGATALTTTSAALLAPVIAAGFLTSRGGMKNALFHSAAALALGVCVAGAWYMRNQLLTGDAFLWTLHREVFGKAFVRDWPMGAVEFLNLLRLLHRSFWGVFGSMNVPLPYPIYWTLEVFTAISAVGFIRCLLRRAQTLTPAQLRVLLVFLLTVLLFFASIVSYNFRFVSAQGRYMFVALPAIGVLGATGFIKGLGKKPALVAGLVFGGLLLLDAFSLFFVVWPAYH